MLISSAHGLCDNHEKIEQRAGLTSSFIRCPSKEYREEVLPRAVRARVAVEAGCPLGWERFVSFDGVVLGISRFGASAPGSVVLEKLGISVDTVVRAAKEILGQTSKV
ncbi:hypothetical protein H5T57_05445 [Candidatus Bipolaricaulota bacterium]|nr:hypothetical protein [Candidatus Bipolaricaulota bacterium]